MHGFNWGLQDMGNGDEKQEIEKKSEMDMTSFYNAPSATTTGYLARAVVNNILQGDMGLAGENLEEFAREEMCQICQF